MSSTFSKSFLPTCILLLHFLLCHCSSPDMVLAQTEFHQVGVLMLPAPYAVEMEEGFRTALASCGYIHGHNIDYILKVLGPEKSDYEDNKQVARQLLDSGIDLIATIGTGASTPVWQVVKHTTVPMVFAGVTYPIQGGLIEEFNKPTGTNITGISYGVSPDTRLKIFRKMFPDKNRFRRLGFIYSSVMEQEIAMVHELRQLTQRSGFEFVFINFYSPSLEAPDFSIVESNVPNVDLLFGWYTLDRICADSSLLQRMLSFPLPVLGITSSFTDVGAIGGVLTDHIGLGAEHAKLVSRVLSGVSPGEIPPRAPSSYHIEINLARAQELNIDIPLEIIGASSRIVRAP